MELRGLNPHFIEYANDKSKIHLKFKPYQAFTKMLLPLFPGLEALRYFVSYLILKLNSKGYGFIWFVTRPLFEKYKHNKIRQTYLGNMNFIFVVCIVYIEYRYIFLVCFVVVGIE